MSNGQFELHQFLPCRLAELSNSIVRSVAELFEESYDLSITEWKVMVTVARHPGLSAVAVAQFAGLDTVAVSRAVTKLMDAGRIHREFGLEDRRRSILKLSDDGLALYEEVLPLAKELQSSLLEGFTAEERAVFAKAIDKLGDRSRDFVADIRYSRQHEPAVRRTANRPVPLRSSPLSLTKSGLGVMPSRRAS